MIRAIPDLAGVALLFVALAFLLTAKAFAVALRNAINVSIGGLHPLSGVATALENTIISWCNAAIKSVEKAIAWFFRDLTSSLQLFVGLAALAGFSAYKALSYMWTTALPAFVKLQTDALALVARKAETLATALVGSIAQNLGEAKTYAESQALRALSDAQVFASTQDAVFTNMLRREFGEGIDTLRAAESSALTGALTTAQAGIAAAERLAGSALAQSEAAAERALAEAEARGADALSKVRDVAVGVGDDLTTIEGKLGALGTAGLIAAIPAIATLVHAIATEAGLEDAACRAKNKAICGTDPLQWAGLLAGLAALGLSFDLSDVVKLAAEGVGEAGNLLADVGKIPQDVVQSVGGVIGQVALGIAA